MKRTTQQTPPPNNDERNQLVLPATGLDVPARSGPDPLTAYLATLSPRSRRTTMNALDRVSKMFGTTSEAMPWQLLRHHHVAAIRKALEDGEWAPATANASIAAIKGVLKSAWRMDLLTTDDYHRAVDVRHIPGSRLPAGRALDAGETAALLRSCVNDDSPSGRRDAALLALLAGAGLRRAEAAALKLADYDAKDESARLVGKGGKERKAFFLDGGSKLVNAWLDERGREPGPLLLKVTKHGRIIRDGQGMTDQAVMLRVIERSRRAGLGKVTPHDLRRSFVTLLLESGADVLSVQRLAGHASATTTATYDRRPEMEAKRAAQSVRLL